MTKASRGARTIGQRFAQEFVRGGKPTDQQVTGMADLLSNQVQASSSWSLVDIKKGAISFITPPNDD